MLYCGFNKILRNLEAKKLQRLSSKTIGKIVKKRGGIFI